MNVQDSIRTTRYVRILLSVIVLSGFFLSLGCSGPGPVPCNQTTTCPPETGCDPARSLCLCKDGARRSCYSGATNTQGVGRCKAGVQVCSAGKWGACSGEVLPTKETCGDNLDNDCNGVIDNGCPTICVDGATRRCYTGPPPTLQVGACQSGTQVCSAGKWGACTGQVLPKVEVCEDSLDNNCDGQVDENCNTNCTIPPVVIYKIRPIPMYTGAPRSAYLITLTQQNAVFAVAPKVTVSSGQVESLYFDPKRPTRVEVIVIAMKSTLTMSFVGEVKFGGNSVVCKVPHSETVPFCDSNPTQCNNQCKVDADCLTTQSCAQGECKFLACSQQQPMICVHACKDLNTDPQNCGACGNSCASGQCQAGLCVGEPFHGGNLLSTDQMKRINAWIGTPAQKWTLCYKRSLHGANPGVFHKRCDGKGPSVTIIELNRGKSTARLIGGYADVSWGGNGYIGSASAFLFSLTNSYKHSYYRNNSYVYSSNSYGPTWGGGYDFYTDLGTKTSCKLGHSYRCRVGTDTDPKCYNDFCGTVQPVLDEVEVYVKR